MAYELCWHPRLPHTLVIVLGGEDLHIDDLHELNAKLNCIMQAATAPLHQIYDLRTFTRVPRGLLSDLPYFLRTDAMYHTYVGSILITHVRPSFMPLMRVIASAHPASSIHPTLEDAFAYVETVLT